MKADRTHGARHRERCSGGLERTLLVVAGSTAAAASVIGPMIAIGVTGLVGVVVTALRRPQFVCALVLPLSFVTLRVPSGGPSASVADLILAVALVTAIIGCRSEYRQAAHDRWAVWLLASAYFALMLTVVAMNPSMQSFGEIAHRAALVIGSVIVGASMSPSARALSIGLFVATAFVFSVAAVLITLTQGGPAYPLGVTKNHAGGLIAIAIMVCLFLPDRSTSRHWAAVGVLLAGLASTDSRAGIIALAVCIAYGCLVDAKIRKRLALPLVLVVAMSTSAALSLESERSVPEDVSLSSANERLSFWEHAYADWIRHPLFGNGIGYYVDPRYDFPVPYTAESPQGAEPNPHNIVMQTIAESGVVGAFAFSLLTVGTVVVLASRCRGRTSLTAQAAVIGTVCIGLFDIFWLAGRTTVPFVLVGAALRAARDRSGQVQQVLPEPRHAAPTTAMGA